MLRRTGLLMTSHTSRLMTSYSRHLMTSYSRHLMTSYSNSLQRMSARYKTPINYSAMRRYKATVSIKPDFALIDDQLDISVSGLKARQPITFHIYLKEGKIRYTSCAHYVTDADGNCDVTTAASVGGMYTGVEPMGLFWSMEAGPDEPWGRRLIKFDVTTPYEPQISVYDGHLDWKQCMAEHNRGSWLAAGHCRRTYMADDVTRHVVRHGPLRGTLFKPGGKGPFPAVVDLFGLIGGLVEFRAAAFASRGIAALAVSYFNYEDLPKTIDRLDLDYFYQAIDYLNKQPFIRTDHGLGVCGVSQGGQVAALMASHFPDDIKCCIMINSGIYNLLLAPWRNGKFLGRKLSSIDDMLQRGIQLPDGTVDCTNIFQDFNLNEQTRVPIERSKARTLLLASCLDACVPSELASLTTAECLEKGGNYDYEILRLPGAGHLLEPPYSPMNPVMQSENGKLASGGEKVGHAMSQELAWKKMLDFINETLNP